MRTLLILILCWLNGAVQAQVHRDRVGGRASIASAPTSSNVIYDRHSYGSTPGTSGGLAVNLHRHHFYHEDYWPAPYYSSRGASSSLEGYP